MSSFAPSRPDVGVVVVAAGRGLRAGAGLLKQFRAIGGVPMLLRAVRPFLIHPEVRTVVVVLPAESVASPPDWLGSLAGDRLRIVAGGAERIDSVEAGLVACGLEVGVILVHDGARPFVDSGVINAVIAEAQAGRGAIAAVPVTDTLKTGSPGLGPIRVVGTVPRDDLWRAQTPQGFPRRMLAAALAAARRDGRSATDDAALCEAIGATVTLIEDRTTNFKVTSADDFMLAEAMAKEFR